MNKGIRAAIAIGILGLGVGSLVYMVKTRPEAKRSVHQREGAAVEVVRIDKVSTEVTVRARGTVMPARQVILGTEVGGKVIEISSELLPGGRFAKGDVIARINPADYRLALEQQFANVDSAEAQLAIEESRRAVAAREWELFGSKRGATGNKELALREPQMRSASTQLKSARSGLEKARLSVERTLLRAPFDGTVQMRNVELGQIVGPGSGLLNFVGTEHYWVQISVPVERLVWISVPGVSGEDEGSPVTIHHRVGDQHIERQGRVLRLLSEVDPAGRMARLLVEVDDPLGMAPVQSVGPVLQGERPEDARSKLPLLLGAYVEVEIAGRNAEHVVELQRSGLRDGDLVYIMTPAHTLEKRAVEVLWRREDTVVISSGLQVGDLVIMSPIAAAIEGMKLRLPANSKPTKEPAAQAVPQPSGQSKPAATVSTPPAAKGQPL